MQTDSAKAVSATKRYDAFGNAVSSTGTWQGAFGYAGDFGYQEDASGLKLLGHRYYDSSTGRFLTRDRTK
ncbi:MAG: RHS repeat-associated core domain-containing protein, partial [Armatimonadota bacterium]